MSSISGRNKRLYLLQEESEMPAIKKQVNEGQHGRAIVDHNIKSHANDPLVLKKVERAKQMVDKYGLPGDKKK